jgi:hypothetical protein
VPVTVVTAHFKSKLINYARQQGLVGGSQFNPNDEGERLRYAGYAIFRRTGEAMTIRARLDQLLAAPLSGWAGSAVVFCGDLNDERPPHHPDRCRAIRLRNRPASRLSLLAS